MLETLEILKILEYTEIIRGKLEILEDIGWIVNILEDTGGTGEYSRYRSNTGGCRRDTGKIKIGGLRWDTEENGGYRRNLRILEIMETYKG